jgi:hypothetical protein
MQGDTRYSKNPRPRFRSREGTPSRLCQLLCPSNRQMGTVAHSQTHATITVKLFCFSRNVENKTVVCGRPPALGAGGLEFKSPRPDQNISPHQSSEMKIGDHALGSTRPPPRHSALSAFAGRTWNARDAGGGLPIQPDLFAQTYFRLFCLR